MIIIFYFIIKKLFLQYKEYEYNYNVNMNYNVKYISGLFSRKFYKR